MQVFSCLDVDITVQPLHLGQYIRHNELQHYQFGTERWCRDTSCCGKPKYKYRNSHSSILWFHQHTGDTKNIFCQEEQGRATTVSLFQQRPWEDVHENNGISYVIFWFLIKNFVHKYKLLLNYDVTIFYAVCFNELVIKKASTQITSLDRQSYYFVHGQTLLFSCFSHRRGVSMVIPCYPGMSLVYHYPSSHKPYHLFTIPLPKAVSPIYH